MRHASVDLIPLSQGYSSDHVHNLKLINYKGSIVDFNAVHKYTKVKNLSLHSSFPVLHKVGNVDICVQLLMELNYKQPRA